METNLDLLRTIDRAYPKTQTPIRPLFWVAALLAIAAIVAMGMEHGHPGFAASTGSVAYCVTVDGSPAHAGLRTGLYSADENGLLEVDSSVTGANGCGRFESVALDTVFFVSAWSADGSQIENSAWFEPGQTNVAPVISIDSTGVNRLALH